VTAACLWGLSGVKTHLVAFDTEVVDLTADVTDPVELLLKVQLGGGTDIARAVAYGAGLIENPRRTILVVITDFFENGSPAPWSARWRVWWSRARAWWAWPPSTRRPIPPTTGRWPSPWPTSAPTSGR
jgi:hypothetical protein